MPTAITSGSEENSREKLSGTSAIAQPMAPVRPNAAKPPIQAARLARLKSPAPAATPTMVVSPVPMPKVSGDRMSPSRLGVRASPQPRNSADMKAASQVNAAPANNQPL